MNFRAAASNTSGGSSGSPVLNDEGSAVGLNAGGATSAAASFYLPLTRVVKALRALQEGVPVRRGTLRCVFQYHTFDEVRRLGLRKETEALVRSQSKELQGMLVVSEIVPGGSAEKALQVGDILVDIEQRLSPLRGTLFEDLEDELDLNAPCDAGGASGGSVRLRVSRGGQELSVTMDVEDLHSITPGELLEAGGASVHQISYQAARNWNLRIGSGVFVAWNGFVLDNAGLSADVVITHVNAEETPTLAAFLSAVRKLKDHEHALLRFFHVAEQHVIQQARILWNGRWFPMAIWRRVDDAASWEKTHVPRDAEALQPLPREPNAVRFVLSGAHSPGGRRAIRSLCRVNCNISFVLSGVPGYHYLGFGIVVDARRGLILTDKNTVPCTGGQVSVVFPAGKEMPAKLLFLHPVYSIAVLQVDAQALAIGGEEESEHEVCDAIFDDTPVEIGDEMELVAQSRANADLCVTQVVTVNEVFSVYVPPASIPRFRAINEVVFKFEEQLSKSLGGVLVDKASGRIRGIYASYSFQHTDDVNYDAWHATSVDPMLGFLRALEATRIPAWTPSDASAPASFAFESPSELTLPSLECEFQPISLSEARSNLDVPVAWISRLQNASPTKSQAITVRSVVHESPQSKLLREGDVLLKLRADAVGTERVIATYRDIDAAVADAVRGEGPPHLDVTLIRDRQELTVRVPLVMLDGSGTTRVVRWCGALLQAPYRALLDVSYHFGGVYVSYFNYGSPAHQYSLKPRRFITEMNGEPVRDLDDFLRVARTIEDRSAVRVRMVDLSGQESAMSLKTDYAYWPTQDLVFHDADWKQNPAAC